MCGESSGKTALPKSTSKKQKQDAEPTPPKVLIRFASFFWTRRASSRTSLVGLFGGCWLTRRESKILKVSRFLEEVAMDAWVVRCLRLLWVIGALRLQSFPVSLGYRRQSGKKKSTETSHTCWPFSAVPRRLCALGSWAVCPLSALGMPLDIALPLVSMPSLPRSCAKEGYQRAAFCPKNATEGGRLEKSTSPIFRRLSTYTSSAQTKQNPACDLRF